MPAQYQQFSYPITQPKPTRSVLCMTALMLNLNGAQPETLQMIVMTHLLRRLLGEITLNSPARPSDVMAAFQMIPVPF